MIKIRGLDCDEWCSTCLGRGEVGVMHSDEGEVELEADMRECPNCGGRGYVEDPPSADCNLRTGGAGD